MAKVEIYAVSIFLLRRNWGVEPSLEPYVRLWNIHISENRVAPPPYFFSGSGAYVMYVLEIKINLNNEPSDRHET